MTLELINALAAVGTFLVIAVSAIAAFVQLRHLRTSNQLAGLLHTVNVFEDKDFQSKLTWLRDEFPAKMKDAKFLAELRYPGSLSRTDHPELAIADLWEQTGVYIKYGLVSEDAFMDLVGGSVLQLWNAVADAIKIRREVTSDAAYENFEYVAARALEWRKRHLTNYPPNAPKLLPRSGS
ncbi:MAG TPA: DUF4760 domain-containing protein [Candidatus Eremiobacteraceae bacterium]|nr:DUF4760 domain-containing protein [Candidatus Eremiobacteraceae bacterium]